MDAQGHELLRVDRPRTRRDARIVLRKDLQRLAGRSRRAARRSPRMSAHLDRVDKVRAAVVWRKPTI